MMDGGQPDLLGHCDRCDSIHRPSQPCRGVRTDGGLVKYPVNDEMNAAFRRARISTAFNAGEPVYCEPCDCEVKLGDEDVAAALDTWQEHAENHGGEA